MKLEDLTLQNFNAREFKVHMYMLDEIGVLKNPARPLAVVIPGGSFDHLSKRESEPVALAFNNQGFNSVVMDYNLVDEGDIYPDAGLDVLTTVQYFRKNAQEYSLDPQKIVTVGFSAGGHVASIANNMADSPVYQKDYGFDSATVRPNKTILGYPLIDIAKIGFDVPEDEIGLVPDNPFLRSSTVGVNKDTPATFIFHAWDDPVVLIANTIDYLKALADYGVGAEAHLFNKGGHGFSLARPDMVIKDHDWQDNPHAAHWFTLANEWLNSEWNK